jgi:hypothetical protein
MAEFHNKRKGDMDSDIRLAFSRQGAPTSPMTPNQIGEMGRLLNSGMKNIEVGTLKQEDFETIPIQHFDEMRRTAKLTGSKISIHAPILDPAGIGQQGYSDEEREASEEYIKTLINKAHILDPEGNTPINIHSTGGIQGAIAARDEEGNTMRYKEDEWRVLKDYEGNIVEKTLMHKKGDEVVQVLPVINRESGQMAAMKREELHYIEKNKVWTPEERLANINETSWDDEKLKLMAYQKSKQEFNHMNQRIMQNPAWLELNIKAKNMERGQGELTKEEWEELNRMNSQIELNKKQIQQNDVHLISGLNTLHDKFSKYSNPKTKLEKQEFKESKKHIEVAREMMKATKEEEKATKELIKIKKSLASGSNLSEEVRSRAAFLEDSLEKRRSEKFDQVLFQMSHLSAPEIFVSTEDFAKEKTVETMKNAAKYAFKKFGKTAPLITIENVMPNMVLSRGESLSKLVKDTRKEFTKEIMEEKGLDKKEAKKIAEKIIGATWDVGHIHQLKSKGYTDEEIVAETKKVAQEVKHVHLTDNFGFGDSHLALGMGNVPIKEHLKILEGEADEERRNIVESGAYAAQFKTSPLPPTLEHLNSPVYTYEAGPSWTEARDMYASYLVGFGDVLPQKHFESFYGAGFSRLPTELGGQAGGTQQSRFSGTPNQ